MLFWIREIVGWLLVLIGLAAFWLSVAFLGERQVVEASVVAGIGIFVFRGGIHLIKVATAARIVLHAHRQDREARERGTVGNRAKAGPRG